MLMIHRARDLLVRQRTAAVNALRGHLAEFRIVAARGDRESSRADAPGWRRRTSTRDGPRGPQIYRRANPRHCEIRLKSFRAKGSCRSRRKKRGLQAADDGTIDWSLYRHRDRGDRRRSSQFRLWTSFYAAWLGLTPKQHSTGRKRKAWRNKQARRQLYPSVTHSWRSGDRGSRAERSDEERLALRASGAAACQRRHRRLGKQDRSCRMGGHVDRANLSKGRLIAGRPTVSAVRGQTDA